MVHTRINERTVNPNSHINFICALPSRFGRGPEEDHEAKEVLRALAAQLKPVMKRHGLTVNSLEEYENNKVFLGRNWNNGETIELVLRDDNDRFYPASMLLSVFCHELAHIKHMNHSGAFHSFRRQLSSEVAALHRQGYYGDGYWSAGNRLSDSERIPGEGVSAQEFPEYTCGGAHAQSRSSVLPPRRRRPGPGRKKRKPGSRITSKTVFESAGEGSVLDEHVEKGGKGSGFRKKAGSQRAREERALAAEKRLMMSQGRAQKIHEKTDNRTDSEDEGLEDVWETDEDRLKRMRDVLGTDGLEVMRDDAYDDIVILSSPRAVSGGSSGGAPQPAREKPLLSDDGSPDLEIYEETKRRSVDSGKSEDAPTHKRRRIARGGGLASPETIGTVTPTFKADGSEWTCDMCTYVNSPRLRSCAMCERPRRNGQSALVEQWSCSACTFDNKIVDGKCTMCDHPRSP